MKGNATKNGDLCCINEIIGNNFLSTQNIGWENK